MAKRRPVLPLAFADSIIRLEDLGVESTEGTVFEEIGIDSLDVEVDDTSGIVTLRVGIAFASEVTISPPGTNDLAVVLGAPDDVPSIPVVLKIGSELSIGAERLKSRLRLPPTVLARARAGTGDEPRWVRDASQPYEVPLPELSFTLKGTGDFEVEGTPSVDVTPAFIGDTGLVFEATDVGLHLDSTATPPPGRRPGFRGLFIDSATLYLPESFGGGTMALSVADAGAGSDGVFGEISMTFENTLSESAPHVTGPGTGAVLGMPFALKEVSLRIDQNVPVAGALEAELLLPFFRKATGLEIGIDASGELLLRLKGVAPSGGEAAPLGKIELENVLRLDVESAEIKAIPGEAGAPAKGEIAMSGALKPLVAGVDWPTLDIDRLSVDTGGKFQFDGGWIDVPESTSLDFHAFKVDLEQVGFGSEQDDEGHPRQWVGLSGGVRLIEGVPLSAAVEGLRVSWAPKTDVVPYDPKIEVDLEGIEVHLEVPGTLQLDGRVTYEKPKKPLATRPAGTRDESTAESAAGVYGHLLKGSVRLDITALRMEVAAELMVGELKSYSYVKDAVNPNTAPETLVEGEAFTAFYIVLSAQLPTALPLGATGAGLYGIKGLFGMHVAPNRLLDAEGEPEAWYSWYKADRGNNSGYNVTSVVKWAPRKDHFAFGAGLTLGTVFDDGFTVNVGALAAIMIPGPVVMIEGRANLLKQRTGNGQGLEGALYALIVFDGLAETFQMNIDLNLSIEDVVTVSGGLEAFFDFNDGDRWHVWIGKRFEPGDPEDKRIRAEILSIVTARSYFMIEPTGIAFGADAGIDLQLQEGPLEIKFLLRLAFNLAMSWRQPQLTGDISLYLELTIVAEQRDRWARERAA